jgi:hypothetical protein
MDAKRYGWGLGLAFLILVGAVEAPALGQQYAPRMSAAAPGNLAGASASNSGVMGQRFLVETQHFRVMSQDPEFAKQVATMAEAYRNHLAMHWLGRELPEWHEKGPIDGQYQPEFAGQWRDEVHAGRGHYPIDPDGRQRHQGADTRQRVAP